MVTITDIARRLGVAVSTVSKGLNGANDVSESTRALILKTAVEMGYAGRKVQKSGVRKVCVLAEREEFLSAGQFGYDLAMGFRTTAAAKRLASRFGALSGASVLSGSFGYLFAPP